jgi:hypothetical protein
MLALQQLRSVSRDVCAAIGRNEPYDKDATRFYYGEDDPKP